MIRNVFKRSEYQLKNVQKQFLSSGEKLEKTAFYDLHLSLGGKMVPFAGYELPVQYEGYGVKKEHEWTRSEGKASLFDVSHMGQINWYGKDAVKFIEKVVCGDIASLKSGEGKLSLIMNENGGIMDDTVISNAGEFIYMVVNGACKHKDMEHFNKYMSEAINKEGLDVTMEYMHDQQLLALQGPGAASSLSTLCPSIDFNKMPFMAGTIATVAGIDNCRVTRCGYTGEDGFEISVNFSNAPALMEALLSHDAINPCGLGARDSLRLEAGLCLYGNDLDENTNPVEGALTWTIGGPKTRRRKEQGFLGADKFLTSEGKLIKQQRKRIGIAGMKAPARDHTEIYTSDGETILGQVTSGGFGPTFGKPLAMGYVPPEYAKDGTELNVKVRGKMQPCVVTKMPFVETKYFRVG